MNPESNLIVSKAMDPGLRRDDDKIKSAAVLPGRKHAGWGERLLANPNALRNVGLRPDKARAQPNLRFPHIHCSS
jgi:hypothetical protein